jgi:hypothetical protein
LAKIEVVKESLSFSLFLQLDSQMSWKFWRMFSSNLLICWKFLNSSRCLAFFANLSEKRS